MTVDEKLSEELAQRQLDAYNARDLEAFVPCFSEDVEVRTFGTNELLFKGRADFRARYESLFKSSPTLHCELVNRIVMGPFVFDQERVTGRLGGADVTRVVAIYDVRGGLIVRVWFARPDAP